MCCSCKVIANVHRDPRFGIESIIPTTAVDEVLESWSAAACGKAFLALTDLINCEHDFNEKEQERRRCAAVATASNFAPAELNISYDNTSTALILPRSPDCNRTQGQSNFSQHVGCNAEELYSPLPFSDASFFSCSTSAESSLADLLQPRVNDVEQSLIPGEVESRKCLNVSCRKSPRVDQATEVTYCQLNNLLNDSSNDSSCLNDSLLLSDQDGPPLAQRVPPEFSLSPEIAYGTKHQLQLPDSNSTSQIKVSQSGLPQPVFDFSVFKNHPLIAYVKDADRMRRHLITTARRRAVEKNPKTYRLDSPPLEYYQYFWRSESNDGTVNACKYRSRSLLLNMCNVMRAEQCIMMKEGKLVVQLPTSTSRDFIGWTAGPSLFGKAKNETSCMVHNTGRRKRASLEDMNLINKMSRREVLNEILIECNSCNMKELDILLSSFVASHSQHLTTSQLRQLVHVLGAVPKHHLFSWISGQAELPTRRLAPLDFFENPTTAKPPSINNQTIEFANEWRQKFVAGQLLLAHVNSNHPLLRRFKIRHGFTQAKMREFDSGDTRLLKPLSRT